MTTQKHHLIIIDQDTEMSSQVTAYFQANFAIESIVNVNSFTVIEENLMDNALILTNASLFNETNEIVSMAQIIKKHAVSVIVYFDDTLTDISSILDAIELGAIEAVSANIFSTDSRCSDSERQVFNEFISSVLRTKIVLDIDLLRLRLYPFANDELQTGSKKAGKMIVVGADFGSASTLLGLIPQIPPGFKHSMCILMNGNNRVLEAFVDRLQVNSSISVNHVNRDTFIEQGCVYIVSANRTPVLDAWDNNKVSILVNNSLPFEMSLKHWIDPFMFLAAEIYGKNTVGILLSGVQQDGVWGLEKINEQKGITIVQSNKSCVGSNRLSLARKKKCAQKVIYAGDLAGEIMQL